MFVCLIGPRSFSRPSTNEVLPRRRWVFDNSSFSCWYTVVPCVCATLSCSQPPINEQSSSATNVFVVQHCAHRTTPVGPFSPARRPSLRFCAHTTRHTPRDLQHFSHRSRICMSYDMMFASNPTYKCRGRLCTVATFTRNKLAQSPYRNQPPNVRWMFFTCMYVGAGEVQKAPFATAAAAGRFYRDRRVSLQTAAAKSSDDGQG